MFVDEVKIHVKAGDGGAGCASFRREAHVPKGGPDGGDGGQGGECRRSRPIGTLSTLIDFHYKRHFKAERGTHGKGADLDGARGPDLVLHVPMGTVVRARRDRRDSRRPHATRSAPGRVARGGRGGLGNRTS